MPKRSYDKFAGRLKSVGLYREIEKLARAARVSMLDLYEGPRMPSIIEARRAVYRYLQKEGKSIHEIARLFDRMPNGVWKLLNGKAGR